MISEKEILKAIKETEFPTIKNLAEKLNANRQYISVLINSMQDKGLVQSLPLGNNKIFRVVE